MTKPLATQILTPQLYYGDEEVHAHDHITQVEGEIPVDFGTLPTDEGDEAPVKEVVKEAAKPPAKEPVDDSEQQQEEEEEEQLDDPDDIDEAARKQQEKEARRAKKKEEASKTAEEIEAQKIKDEEAAKAKKDGKPEVKKQEEGDEEEDADLKAIQPKPGSSPQTHDGFKQLKTKISEERKKAATYKTELDALKANPIGNEEATKAIEENKGLKQRLELLEAGNNPEFVTHYAKKQQEANDSMIKLLTDHPKLQMNKEDADAIKAMEVNSPEWIAEVKRILDTVRVDPFLYKEVEDAAFAASKVPREKAEKLKQLETDRHAFYEARHKEQYEKYVEAGKIADDTLSELIGDQEWVMLKAIEPTDTKEQKAAAEAHNKNIQDNVVPKFKAAFQAIHDQNPKEYTKLVYAAMERDIIQDRLKAMEAELDKSKKYIETLESKAAGVRRIAAPKAEGAPIVAPTKTNDMVGGDADDALDAFRNSMNK